MTRMTQISDPNAPKKKTELIGKSLFFLENF